MATRKFKVLVDVGKGLHKKVFSVSAPSRERAVDLAQARAMKEFPKHVVAATALRAKVKVLVVGGK